MIVRVLTLQGTAEFMAIPLALVTQVAHDIGNGVIKPQVENTIAVLIDPVE